MRLLLVLTILSGVALGRLAAYAQEADGQADLSSNWAHEPGFPNENEFHSKAQLFLNAVYANEKRVKKPTDLRSSEAQPDRPQEP